MEKVFKRRNGTDLSLRRLKERGRASLALKVPALGSASPLAQKKATNQQPPSVCGACTGCMPSTKLQSIAPTKGFSPCVKNFFVEAQD